MPSQLFRLMIRVASSLAPTRTARWAAGVFFTPRRRSPRLEEALPPPDREQAVDGAYLRRWGDEADCIYLLHGWEGRHSQFHVLLPALRRAGYAVLTIDPPAHGRAEGERSNPGLFAQALLAAARAEGAPAAVVGHSMGAGAAMLATSQGLEARALILLAAPSNVRALIRGFGQFIGLGRRAAVRLRHQIEAEVGLPLEALDVAQMASGSQSTPPALIIHDREDRRIPLAHAEDIVSHWPDATLSMTRGLGHQRLLADAAVVQQIVGYLGSRLAQREAA